jgi:hypothetical protein
MCYAHCHGGTDGDKLPGHDQIPHLHLIGTADHPHDGADHDHLHNGDDHDDGEPAAPDHDDDAVYVPVSVVLGWGCMYSQDAPGDVSAWLPMMGPLRVLFTVTAPPLPRTRPPPLPLYQHCAVYLQTLTLLI